MVKRLAWFEPFWLLLWGALLLLPTRFAPAAIEPILSQGKFLFILAIGLGWIVRWIAYGRLSRPSPINLPLLLMLLWLPVNYWISLDKALSLAVTGYLILGISLCISLINWPPIIRRPQWIAWALVLFGVGLLLAAPLLSQLTDFTIFTLYGLSPLFTAVAAITPGDVNLNRMGGALVLLYPLFLALGLRWDWSSRRWLPPLSLLLAGLAVIVLLLTQSRGAYVGAMIATILLLLLRWRRLVVVLPLLFIVAVFVFNQISVDNLFDQIGNSTGIYGLEGRMELWSRGISALTDFAITGIGIGTFDLVIPMLYPTSLIAPGTPMGHAHNMFIQVGVDLGLPGLAAFLALYINVFVVLASVLRQRQLALPWTLASGVAGGLIAMLVHGLIDVPLWGTKPSFLPWILIALAIAIGLQVRDDFTEAEHPQGPTPMSSSSRHNP